MPTVLIIDDMPENIEVLADYLDGDHDIKLALSGPEGLKLAEEALPDLILLDAMMPGMDGYEACRRLKGNPMTTDIPIIFVTAKNDAESESRALAAGAVDFIHKPVNRDVVRARVRIHLALKARERELSAANAQLNDLNAHLEQRVEERTQALRDAMLLAEAAHKAKHLFLANVNHELRTPMSAILGLSELLIMQLGDSALKERVDKIGWALNQLLGVVNNIIDVSELQAGKVELEQTDFAVGPLVSETIEAWRGRAGAKGLVLAQEIDPALPPRLKGDRSRLAQVLDNLVGNAVKFSERGTITVRACMAEANGAKVPVRLEVADQGIGIDPKHRAAIFKVFEQADNSGTRKHGGCGLGLAICKQLMELMGGRIGVDSLPGQGSTFWVTVPLERGAGSAAIVSSVPETLVSPEANPAPKVDLQRVRQVLVPMVGMLAADDIGAYMIWAREKPLLEDILGDRAEAFNTAMEDIDFKAALEELCALRVKYLAEIGVTQLK